MAKGVLALLYVLCIAETLALPLDTDCAHDSVQLLQVVMPVVDKPASSATGDNATSERQVGAGIRLNDVVTNSSARGATGLTQQQSRCLAACALYALCAFLYQMRHCISTHKSLNVDNREKSWDLAKLWFMLCVLWNHTDGFQKNCNANMNHPWIWLCLKSEMVGFSFLSGVFSASFAVYECVQGKLVIMGSKCGRCFCDYLLATVTIVPLLRLLPMMMEAFENGSLPQWQPLAQWLTETPLLLIPSDHVYWYLTCLYLWTMSVPLLCMLRWPFMISLCVSILCRGGDGYNRLGTMSDDAPFYFLPYFVLGFSLAGGGQPVGTRDECRRDLVQWLTNKRVRVAAVTFVIVVVTLFEKSLISIVTLRSAYLDGLFRNVVPWSAGGILADAVSHMFLLLLTLVAIVVCFMLPNWSFLSTVGSRTLYIYMLHLIVLRMHNFSEGMQSLLVPYSCPVQLLLGISSVLTIAMVLGSDLTMRLTHHFVRPQWLMSLLAPVSKAV